MATHNKPTFPVGDSAQTEGSYGGQYVPRAIPPNIGIRQPEPITSQDIEVQPLKYLALALIHLRQQMGNVARMTEDRSRPVDEYQPQEVIGEQESSITVSPQWEVGEKITSVIVAGPPGNVTVQLGDRIWPLTIPATGILVIAPVGILLGRSDTRQITAATPGQYTLELMGYCDSRSQLL